MKLDELIKDYSLNTVSQKTKIPVEVLEKLVNKEWDKLQKAKVNGFLQIIEREFEIDLSEIKEEAKAYYAEHKKEEPNRPIDLVDAQIEGGSAKRVVANLLTLVILGLVAYAAWFYLAKVNTNVSTTEENSSKGMFKDSIEAAKDGIKAAKKFIGVEDTKHKGAEVKKQEESQKELTKTVNQTDKEIQEDKTKEENKTKRVIKKFDITSANESSSEINSNTKNSINSNLATSSQTVALENITKNEENETADTNTQNSENNISTKTNVNLTDENKKSITTQKEANEEGIDVKLDENITETAMDNNVSDNNTSIEAVHEVTITPTVKRIWIGIYNLKTKKRVVKVATGAYTYNTDGGDVAIVTGHSKFKISTDTGASSQYNNARRKKYLLVTKDGIKVLTKQEYRKVTKRRAW